MNENEIQLLEKLGIIVTDIVNDHDPRSPDGLLISGNFLIDESRFRPMCSLIKIVDMICESKSPGVEEQFNQLITMLNLTQEK